LDEEVRYHMLRPAQVLERRRSCPVAYVPLGNLEWHGVHNPYGTDTLQAEAMAIMCARRGGGIAFPPLYYGESRLEALMEANASDRDDIARNMGLDPGNFKSGRQAFTATEQALNYQRLLLHILVEVETLGFELGVLVAGHYPLIDHARSAALLFNKREYSRRSGMLAWAFVDYLMVRHLYDCAGDHAGGWETSHMLAIHPQTVDLSMLPERGKGLVGAGGKMDPRDARAEFGLETMVAAADLAIKEVRHRLDHRELYTGHGNSLREGMWREDSS